MRSRTRSTAPRCPLPQATGVRASEVIGLTVTDIASQRMTLRVEPVEHSNAISRFATSL